jgi:membrane peptidoglycan carboxypeptidase
VRTMERAMRFGTGTAAVLPDLRPEAGKTGTHENSTDAWFVGYIPQYTTAVWVGFPDSQVEMKNITIRGTPYSSVFGGSVPAPIWRQFMTVVTRDLPVEEFAPNPDGIEVYYLTPREEVPDVVGMDLEEAQEELYEAGFDVEVEYVNSDEPEDEVLAQDPEAESMELQGTTVTIEVSNGMPPITTMPDLVGLNRNDAHNALAALRASTGISFSWSFTNEITDNRERHNTIRRTTPPAGATIDEDTRIEIFIWILEGAVTE